jgi:hypothetical protein
MENKKSFKRTYSADAANIFVRNILCEVSEELGGFSEKDWSKTLKFFDHKCAYTGVSLSKKKIVQDHLIPHNREACGLNLYGNIVPTTKEANGAKSSKDYKDFILNNTSILGDLDESIRKQRIAKIEEFVAQSKYSKIHNSVKDKLVEYTQQQYKIIQDKANNCIVEIASFIDFSETEITESINFHYNNIEEKIELWASKPYTNVHKIIALVVSNNNMSRDELVDKVSKNTLSKNAYGAISSLMTNAGNCYGQVFQEENGFIRFCPQVKSKIDSYNWEI